MNPGEPSEAPLHRVPTGIPGLDTLLGGGWLHGGTYMVTGGPGAGKTILGNQFCFSHVTRGEHAVYVTLLAESHGRMMAHLEQLSFFQREVIGQSLHYVSGYAPLKTEGLDGLARLLYRSVREHQASVLVVDGLLAAQESADTTLAFREFLHSLGVHNAFAGCTTLILTNTQDYLTDPQFTIADGLVLLGAQQTGLRSVRTLEVPKMRGGPHLTGRHTFEILDSGLVVYPRIESLYQEQPRREPEPGRRLESGVPRLDAMLGGGLPACSSTLLQGPPGSGKTLLGLYFLEAGARRDEPGLYFGFWETDTRLLAKAAGVGLNLRPSVDAGRLLLESRAPVEMLPDKLAHDLLDLVKRHQVRRLVLDGLEPFIRASFAPERMNDLLAALLNQLYDLDVTLLVTRGSTIPPCFPLEAPLDVSEALVDNLLALRYAELRSQHYRLLSIIKMRASEYDPALREFSISAQGIEVAANSESAEAILTGQARPRRPKKKQPRKPGPRPPARRRSRS